jgi:hypothetical protein
VLPNINPKKIISLHFMQQKYLQGQAHKKGKTTFIWQKNLSLLALHPHHEP